MGKGNNTSTTQSSSSADPQAAAAYRDILARAQGVASTPYQAYQGDLTAPVNSQQQAGIAGINANANFASPYISQAAGIAGTSTSPITGATIQGYQNPYTQQVIDATTGQLQHDNATQMAQLQGNQIAQGALGGNATGVAKGILAGQQGRTLASTTAGLYNQSYNQALQAAQQQQQTGLAGANAIANYGISGQGAALSGAGAQLGAGTLEQQTQQQQLNALYGQYQQAQAYPYQQTQWLAGLGTGVGSNLGSSSSGSTTAPAPNQTAQYLGAGVAAAGLFLNRGGRVGYANGGVVPHMADGGVSGTPWSGGIGWIPQLNIHGGSAPHAGSTPSAPTQPAFDATKFAAGLSGLGKRSGDGGIGGAIGQYFNPEAYGNSMGAGSGVYGGSSSSPLPGLDALDYGEGFARGGGVGYADGGAPVQDWDTPQGIFGEDVVGDQNRAAGAALLRKGVGTRSLGDAGVINPDDPVRMPDQAAVDAWRAGTPAPGQGVAPVQANDDDEAELPVTANPTQGGPQGLGAAAYKPPYPVTPEDYAPTREDRSSGFGLGLLSPNAKSGLLAAGLGMLASRAPNLGNAIGEGGIAGFSAYGSAEERDRKVSEEARKLSLEAKKAANAEAHTTFTTNESARHNQATEKQAAANADKTKFVPAGSTITADGAYHPLVLDQTSGKVIDAVTGKAPAAGDKVQPKDQKGGPISDDDAKSIAEYYVKTGDNSRLNGLGVTSAARQAVQKHIREAMEKEKVSPEEMGTRVAEFAGRKAGQRTLGVMDAKMGAAANEAEGAIKLTRGIIEKLPRTSFLPINQLIQGYENKTLNPDQAELYTRTQAIINTYAAVMARGANITTDSSRHKAESLLSTANNPEVFNRVLDTLLNEIDMAKHSPQKMREYYRQMYGPKAVADEPAGGAPAAGVAPTAPVTKVINGVTYVNRNGQWFQQ